MRARSYIDHAPYGVFIANERGEYLEVNPGGLRNDRLLSRRTLFDAYCGFGAGGQQSGSRQALRRGRFKTEEPAEKTSSFISQENSVIGGSKRFGCPTRAFWDSPEDTTERRLAEDRKQELERRLNQVQRMESVGTSLPAASHTISITC